MISIARTFGAPESVPAGEAGAQHVELVPVGAQLPAHVRDDVLHVRVLLDHHLLVHLHGPVAADPPQVVAPQVEQHDVLGPLLLVGQQLFGQRRVLRGRLRRAAGSRRWAG